MTPFSPLQRKAAQKYVRDQKIKRDHFKQNKHKQQLTLVIILKDVNQTPVQDFKLDDKQ